MSDQARPSLSGSTITVSIPFAAHRRGGRKIVRRPNGTDERPPAQRAPPDVSLIRLLGRAFRWRRLLESGAYSTVQEISDAEGVNSSYVSRILRLTLLSPTIVQAILDGRQGLQAPALLKPFPIDWNLQQKRFLART
jgi:hypothetical protein